MLLYSLIIYEQSSCNPSTLSFRHDYHQLCGVTALPPNSVAGTLKSLIFASVCEPGLNHEALAKPFFSGFCMPIVTTAPLTLQERVK
jgi:hypothetical protein